MSTIRWQDYIHADPNILVGKPVLKGTRLSLEFLIGLLEAGWSETMIFENYPGVTKEQLRAIFAFMRENILDGTYIHVKPDAPTIAQ